MIFLALTQCVLIGAVIAWIGLPLVRRAANENREARRLRQSAAYAMAVFIPAATIGLYGWFGAPESAASITLATLMPWILGPYAPYIAGSYGAAFIILGGLALHTLWPRLRPRVRRRRRIHRS